ncbi:bifunctional 2-polyprenyl-6-hydroxyphenol methylase/3-demethylubiquinol 3-O-methyltransferase UbiG [Magnetospirillum sp. 64-120]|uniref:bifunctional 2-polyprenyl-6-hydroxyphenol methylase/3-demethylubiquinol 3-O-methyltransferase UbiG n=1 Tax=Magnetospirillum sp. 64-120 TaxID=1895778 RepID=UPI000929A95F|nr:bifunctional 2-polyprenyl-6-hydroxyphenol methylase/3-demethylubiquinol 3-O-methyltransferase UbiG [Magnetospirillum sp. 64-120]OJX67226.1 MAG: bifunctional 3-demethylubiquinol 3-O-methyltransferase/2-polyprenyl-6-hydroxyphenol methylase [Magnetospirillum sp. 64-120]
MTSAATESRQGTASAEEVARFTAMADEWWDPTGKFRPLHRFNPVRLGFIRREMAAHFGRDPQAARPFEGLTLLDVGCGGGLLSEPLARMGFAVTGIDAGERNIAVARIHAEKSGAAVEYRVGGPEDVSAESFDVVLSMEVIEHVPDPARFIALAAGALKPGGVFLGATLNRTAKSYLMAVIGAEYVLRWLPRGTHDWKKFVRPSEFAAFLRDAGIETKAFRGMEFKPLSDEWVETMNLDVNYMLMGVKS